MVSLEPQDLASILDLNVPACDGNFLTTAAFVSGMRSGGAQLAWELVSTSANALSHRLVRICPHCRSAEVRRSRRRGFVEHTILRALFLRPYRCQNCDGRHYGFKFAKKASDQLIDPSHLDRAERA